MRVELEKFVLSEISGTATYNRVVSVAYRLHSHLNETKTLARIDEVNQPGNSSAKVQDVFLKFAKEIGFESEKKGFSAEDLSKS